VEEKPLVSAVIIFKNDEKYLREAIESVFSQTYQMWELILVNDGSTDESTAIAQRYAVDYPVRVRYLEHLGRQNRGKWKSRILGAGNAIGEFIRRFNLSA
jgi:glycosyltransferase involved in cell wall biosynthesis